MVGSTLLATSQHTPQVLTSVEQVTPCNRILLEELAVPKVITKFPKLQ
jgi:hypothetical protein